MARKLILVIAVLALCCGQECSPTPNPAPGPIATDTAGCSNTCSYAYDGVCDDGGPGSTWSLCDYGTDCADCGPREASSGDTADDLLAIAKASKEISISFSGRSRYAAHYTGAITTKDSYIYVSTYHPDIVVNDDWEEDIIVPVTWSGNSFSGSYQGYPRGDALRSIEVSGQLSDDGRSVSNFNAHDVSHTDNTLLPFPDDITHLVTNSNPIPYARHSAILVMYEVTGPSVQDYLVTVQNEVFLDGVYQGTDFNSTENPPRLVVTFAVNDQL